jgi:hypothetical protein
MPWTVVPQSVPRHIRLWDAVIEEPARHRMLLRRLQVDAGDLFRVHPLPQKRLSGSRPNAGCSLALLEEGGSRVSGGASHRKTAAALSEMTDTMGRDGHRHMAITREEE